MNLMKGLICFIILVRAAGMQAGEYQSVSGAEILNLDIGARQTGMGNSSAALADDAQALLYNPAGLGQLNKAGLALSYVNLFSELNLGSLLVNYPFWKGSLGLGLNYISSVEFKEIVNGLEKDNALSYSAFLFQAGYGLRVNRMIQTGLGLKYISSDIGGYNAGAFAIDAGIILGFEAAKFYPAIENNLKIGLSFQNFGSRIRFVEKQERLPEKVRLGVSYKPLTLAQFSVEGDYWTGFSFKKGSLFSLGLELFPEYFVTPRMGLNMDHDSAEFTFGMSIGSAFRKYRYRFDLAYSGRKELGSNLYFTLNLGELPFIQYREEVEFNPAVFPAVYQRSPASSFVYPENRERTSLKIRLGSEQYPQQELNELNLELGEKLRSGTARLEKLEIVDSGEAILLKLKWEKEGDKYKLSALFVSQQDSGELKKMSVKFTSRKSLDKISKRILAIMEKDLLAWYFPSVTISSRPEACDLFLNNRLLGRTPLDVPDVAAGSYQVKLSCPGSRTLETNIVIRNNEENYFQFKLRPEAVLPDQFNIALKEDLQDKKLDAFNQAFQMLLKENMDLFKDYVIMDKGAESRIEIKYSLSSQGNVYLFDLKLTDLAKRSMFKELKYRTESDEKLKDVVNDVLNSLMEYVVREKEAYRETQKVFLILTKPVQGIEVHVNNHKIKLPYQARLDPGPLPLEIYRNGDLFYREDLMLKPGETNTIRIPDDVDIPFHGKEADPSFRKEGQKFFLPEMGQGLFLSSRE
ncbi:MAG: PorV/PorQ family protein [bacterium]|nr:PorV/PorQ family protein [bacterium]